MIGALTNVNIFLTLFWVEIIYTQNMETGYSSETLINSKEIIYTLKMEAESSSETLLYTE
jgi:hypothetical protein